MITQSIFWFRRDLRFIDNHGLFQALTRSKIVNPIFIFDENITKKLGTNDHRLAFIKSQLNNLDEELIKFNSSLNIYYGSPIKIFEKIINENSIDAVFWNKDYEPYAIKRDKEIEKLLKSNNIKSFNFKDQVIFEEREVVKNDGSPYVVYTPYSKKWIEKFSNKDVKHFKSETFLSKIKKLKKLTTNTKTFDINESKIKPPKVNFNNDIIKNYERDRNIPETDGTSKLGLHLRFGTKSIRSLVKKSNLSENKTFLKELIWREFFMQILWHFPETTTQCFKSKYEKIKWRNNMDEFNAWCEGKTGYPIVDAGMRELNETGFMHNRVRMITASFLCKHLLIDWRIGEKYFASKLFDYEQSSNIGNWQWVAGCGVDAAPYFRIFNPYEQQKKFDKEKVFIKKWISEYDTTKYPQEIVNHKLARERCLNAYKEAVS
ncbi:MAG: deoxyribodipyrimidine photo-lyase [Flavobacteriaceae bacterium]|nr:deoxyribodipyrimidine photo-lyase [Flavobacteriaceae bacterium]